MISYRVDSHCRFKLIQFGEKQGTTSVQFKNLLVNEKKAETFILDGVHVREDERDHVESMK